MDSLTHKEAILAWHKGVSAFDGGDSQQALKRLLEIPEAAATSRILYNIGHIYLVLKEYAEASKNFEAAFNKDAHLAAAFYQCGVSLHRNKKFNNARKMFEKTKECLRDNQYIDYKALGMNCRLYKCEILFNLSVAVAAMTKDPEWALDIMSETDKCKKEDNHQKTIKSAKDQIEKGVVPDIFSLPEKEMFRPPKDKIENISKTDYLGQSTVVHAIPGSSVKKPQKPKEEKIVDLPTPRQKNRHSLEPPGRLPPGPNIFKPINSLDAGRKSSPTPPNRLAPSPTSPNPSSTSPLPPNRRPPSSPRLSPNAIVSSSNKTRLSPTPPLRPPPVGPVDKSSGRPSPSPPARPPPVSPSRLSANNSPTPELPSNRRGSSPGKLSHKDTILVWHKAMQVFEAGETSEALDKLLSIPEPTAKILFNIGSMELLTNATALAEKTFELVVEKDEHMAIGYFQYGVSLALQSKYELSWKAFDKARRALRQNDSIDYKQIGLPYKLYECEVLHNQSLMYMYLDEMKLAREVLESAMKKKSETRHSKIDTAMVKLKGGQIFDLFTLPKEAVFKPPASKVENISKVDYLGQKKVVAKFEERDFSREKPNKLPPRLSMDLGNTNVKEEKRRSSSPGIHITHHTTIDEDGPSVFNNDMNDNRCHSPPDLDESDENDTYGPVPDSILQAPIPDSILRAPSPGPPTRQAPSPPSPPQSCLQRQNSLGPPERDAPAPPLPLKPGKDLRELYANYKENNNKNNNKSSATPNSTVFSDKKPLPLPKPKKL